MIKLTTTLLITGLAFSFHTGKAQNNFAPRIETSAGTYLSSSGKTPFLNKTRQYGLVPIESNVLFLNASFLKSYDSLYTTKNKLKPWGFSYGLETQLNLGGSSQLLLPVAHLSGRYKKFELYVGRKREFFGLADTTGTFGSYIWSGNALPIPKIQLSTPGYVPLLGRGFVSAKLGYAHGWFGRQRLTSSYYLHQKWLYVKLGREDSRLNAIAGVNHMAQWGGYSDTLKNDPRSTRNGHFAEDPFVYLNVVVPAGIWKIPPGKYTEWETLNRFGNHLGTVDLGLDLKTASGRWGLYRQTPWEDGQAVEVFFSGDGNYTLTFEPSNLKNIRKISFEFLNTRRQGDEITRLARFFGLKEKHPGELQNYLNHGQYYEGWSYQNAGIGTPAILPHSELTPEAQAPDFAFFSRDNMIISSALSISGNVRKMEYAFQSGYILSSGLLRNQRPQKLNQFSTCLSGRFPILDGKLYAGVDVGIDRGELYGNQTGINLMVTKKWN